MDNTEQSLKILGKFLAIANVAKAYKDSQLDIPKDYLEGIVKELTSILAEYNKIEIEKPKKDVSKIWYSSEDEEEWGEALPYDTITGCDIEDTNNDVGC